MVVLGIYIDVVGQYPRFANQSTVLTVKIPHLNDRVEGQFYGYKVT